MYPNQNNQRQDLFAKLLANKKLLFLIVGVLVVLMITVPLLLAATADKTPGRILAINSHLAALAELSEEQRSELNSASLRDQNANVSIILSGATNDLTAALAQASSASAVDAQAAARHAARLAAIQTALEEARQTNTLDSQYQKQLDTELEVVETQLVVLSKETKRKVVRDTLADIANRLKLGREALAKVSL